MLKVIAIAILALVSIVAWTTMAAGAYVLSLGVGSLQVETPEVDLSLPVPVGLVDLSLQLAQFAVPSEEWHQVKDDLGHDIGAYLPQLEEMTRQLAEGPDGVLVEVRTAREQVLIVKERRRIKVTVDAPDARVRVSIPARALQRITRRLDKLLDLEAATP